jgi:dCMP deaminase
MTDWHNRYFKLAREISTWSKDPSTCIGAVIVGDKGQIISQGYNGFPRGIDDSQERYNDRPLKYKYVVHAEANAIYNAIHNGASTNGASIYISGLPVCHDCAKAIIQSGIKEVYMDTAPSDRWTESCDFGFDMLKEAGVHVEIIQQGWPE